MSTLFRPVVVEGEEWIQRIAHLRVHVWRAEAVLDASWYEEGYCREDTDDEAVHFVVCDGDRLAGAARYTQYDSLTQFPYASDLAAAADMIPEPFALGERLVVHPEYQSRGIWRILGGAARALCYRYGARALVSESAPRVARSMRQRGWVSLGLASPDPRFPGLQYEWMLSNVDLNTRPDDLPWL